MAGSDGVPTPEDPAWHAWMMLHDPSYKAGFTQGSQAGRALWEAMSQELSELKDCANRMDGMIGAIGNIGRRVRHSWLAMDEAHRTYCTAPTEDGGRMQELMAESRYDGNRSGYWPRIEGRDR